MVTAVLRQEELASIKAVQCSDFPIFSSAAEESSGGWQEEGPRGLQSYRKECFSPRASEQSWELGFDLSLVSVSRREEQESRRDSSTDSQSELLPCGSAAVR
jgi:hypothetical protein